MEQFKAIVERLANQATGSSTPSVDRAQTVKLAPPTTDEEYRALKAWAEAQPEKITRPASTAQIEKHLEFLAATLPSKSVDDESGERRFAVYVSLLCQYPNEALQFMAREVCRSLDWFPTPRQCLAYVDAYRPPVSDREHAFRLCSDFAERQFSVWIRNVREGQPLGDAPERWLRIGVEEGVVRRLANGEYVSRALYQGPSKPVPAVMLDERSRKGKGE